jgi:hypothetical protein
MKRSKAGGYLFFAMGVFAIYGLIRTEMNQSYLESGYGTKRPVISAEDNPEGFRQTQWMIGAFGGLCFAIGVILYRRK